MTLKQLLESIKTQIDALTAKAASGENVDAELAALVSQRTTVETAIASKGEDHVVDAPAPATTSTPETELEQLRARDRERTQEATARQIADSIVKQIRTDQAAEVARIAEIAQAEVAKQLGGSSGTIEDIVAATLKNSRGGSRFAAAGADEHVMAQLAAGGSVTTAPAPQIAVGDHRGVKQIREAKNLAHFLAIIAKANRGGFGMTDAERLFLEESQQKAMAEGTNSAGGFLIHPEWMPDILGLLRATAVVRKAGPRVVGFSKEMNQTSISSGATAYYTAENANIEDSELVLAEAPLLTPKNLTGLVPVSNYLLSDAPEADNLVRSDLVEVMALREDLSFLQGTGTGGEPTGMKNMAGRTVDPVALGANGGYLTQPQTRAIRNVTRAFNSQNPKWVWFWPPQFLSHLEGLTDADGRFLADSAILRVNDDGRSGVYDGVPFFLTTQIPVNITTGTSTNTTYLVLVDINELIIGENQALELAVSDEASYTPNGGTTWISAFQAQQTLFRAVLRHDIAHRRPNHVIVQTGVRV